ncbi:MAG: DNA translocase FtsK [Patescibacteria group bacterium]
MMAKKKPEKNKIKEKKEKWHSRLKEETRHSILSLVFFAIGIFITLSAFNKSGVIGNYAYQVLHSLFGSGFFFVPLVFFLITASFLLSYKPHFFSTVLMGGTLFLFSSLGLVEIIFGEKRGGYVGFLASYPLLKLFDFWVSLIIFIILFLISLLVLFNFSFISFFRRKEMTKDDKQEIKTGPEEKIESFENKESTLDSVKAFIKEVAQKEKKEEEDIELRHHKIKSLIPFQPPPLEFLETSKGKPSSGDVKANSNIIKRTLQNFGIDVEMAEVNIGPSVTQYTLKPAEGIKLSRIIALQNDLSLALAAHPIRIEAPIPGKSLIGIEIPNSIKTLVGLQDILSQDEFNKSPYPLIFTLGRDTSGKAIYANLAKMPHLMVAGATGTGKSVMIHTLIISLLYKNSPEMLRFLMIDPKRVELTIYDKIPHLLSPVIMDAKKAIMTFKWATKEMERRYEVLLKAGVRDISSYHKNILSNIADGEDEPELMPNIIIIIDELADLIATYPREVEASIVRLAQMSRAVGIHLVVSTQRPSVEVITGLIKANITSRIAMQVASQVDSRTILDMAGAEKLLGSGDLLFLAGDTSKPKRIQAPFISEKEIKKVVKYLADEYKDTNLESLKDMQEQIENGDGNEVNDYNPDESDDELYGEARELVIRAKKASTSYLQRKFKIGYARAARLMDMMEERGIVGPGEGAKPREVLIKEEENEVIY